MHVVAISGSMRSTSTNSALVRAAAALAPDDMTVTIYEGMGELPHFSPDLDSDPAPESVQRLREQLHTADAILICTPEYAYGMPGSLKNLLDWTVSSGEFYNKPVAALSASPSQGGGERAQASLLLTLTALSANVAEGAKLTIPLVRTKLDPDGHLIDQDTGDALRSVLAALAETVRQPT